MMNRNKLLAAFGFAMAMASSTTAFADDDPIEQTLLFDGELNPSPDNPEITDDTFVDGSTLIIRIDPTRLFGAPGVKTNSPAFDITHAPPELESFYLAGAGTGYSMQPLPPPPATQCQRDGDAPTPAPANTIACTEEKVTKGFVLDPNTNTLFRCKLPINENLASLIKTNPKWAIVQPNTTNVPKCMTDTFEIKPKSPITAGQIESTVNGDDIDSIDLQQDGKIWRAKVSLEKGFTRVTIRLNRGTAPAAFLQLPRIKVNPPKTPSLVRLQAELMATNGGRTVAYAVAITPVKPAFFTKGPWHRGCFLLCTLSPTLIFRLSGEETTNFQVGAGAALFVNRAFQVNGGMLAGTKNLTSRWKPEESWFVGIAIDPFILGDALTQSQTQTPKAPSKGP